MPALRLRSVRPLLTALTLTGCATSPPPRAAAPAARRPADPVAVRAAGELPDETPGDETPREDDALASAGTLETCLAFADARHPALAAAWRDLQAALQLEPQAAGLPDTQLLYRYYAVPVETRVGPQRQALGVRQPLPWFGLLASQGALASREAEVAAARLTAARLAVRAEVQEAFAERYYLARSVDVVRANVELFRQLERVLRVRYGLGAANHPDLIRAQVELGKLEDRLQGLEDMDGAMRARLNAALGRAPDAPLAPPGDLPPEPRLALGGSLAERLEAANPELAALERQADREQAAVEVARRRDRPDFALGLEWIDTGDSSVPGQPDSGQDAWIVSLGLELPTARAKYRAAEREAHHRRAAALERRESTRLDLVARAELASFRLRDAERKLALYGGALLGKARESLAATQKAFGAGQGGFLDLVDAQRVLLDFELTYERARTDHLVQRAKLERLLGQPLVPAADGPDPDSDPDPERTVQPRADGAPEEQR